MLVCTCRHVCVCAFHGVQVTHIYTFWFLLPSSVAYILLIYNWFILPTGKFRVSVSVFNWGGTVVQTVLPRHLSDSSTSYRHEKISKISAGKNLHFNWNSQNIEDHQKSHNNSLTKNQIWGIGRKLFASEITKLQYISRLREPTLQHPLINMGTLVHVELEAGEQCEWQDYSAWFWQADFGSVHTHMARN